MTLSSKEAKALRVEGRPAMGAWPEAGSSPVLCCHPVQPPPPPPRSRSPGATEVGACEAERWEQGVWQGGQTDRHPLRESCG